MNDSNDDIASLNSSTSSLSSSSSYPNSIPTHSRQKPRRTRAILHGEVVNVNTRYNSHIYILFIV